jgi:hypothetical protein
MQNIRANILKTLKIYRFRDLLIDSHNRNPNQNNSITARLWETTRYRFASVGIPITHNEIKLQKLHNIHKGKRAFIIGNGPSLNKCDLHLLKDEITFGVNAIYLNYKNMGFYPTYYVVEDIFVAEDRKNEINSLKGPIKFFGNYLNYCIDGSDDVIWLNVQMKYSDYLDFPHFTTKAARMVWTGGTVSYICLQLAYYMGITEVYLVGFDHSYKIPKDAEINENDIISTSDDPNHFNSNYFGKGYRWHDPKVDRMEKAYLRAKENFEADGRKIFNATVGGNLNIFERVEYKGLFS